MTHDRLTLDLAAPGDWPAIKRELQTSFAVAVVEKFGPLPDGPIPSDADLDRAFAAPGTEVLRIRLDGVAVGGAVVTRHVAEGRNSLDFLFLSAANHGRGHGLRAWNALATRYPEARVWETHTPYFETRNIHFYVNKCGFRIVEFFGPYHSDPHAPPGGGDLPGGGEAFRFEKVMGPEPA